MLLYSYTILHRDALLNAEQKSTLINWAFNAQKDMEAKYPVDCLVKPKQIDLFFTIKIKKIHQIIF